jgi:hypothetical protein
VRATDEASLLKEMVRIICEIGGYPIAFIGYAVEDEAKSIAWQASCGNFDPAALQPAVSWGDNECGQAVSALAIRLGEGQLVRDLSANPVMRHGAT